MDDSGDQKARARKARCFYAQDRLPNKWKDYSALDIVRGDAFGNAERANLWEWHRELDRLDKPVDRDEWQMQVSDVNAYYNPLNNEIVFPAAILQPPFFDPNADDAVNYGGIGVVIGHEMSHGFDDQGRKFGPDGSLKDWWTPADASAFKERAKRLVAEFSRFEALPGLYVKGENTLGENIGDLGGLNIALPRLPRQLERPEATRTRRADRRSTFLSVVRAGLALEIPRRSAPQSSHERRAQSGDV